jgi:hypothetical protein
VATREPDPLEFLPLPELLDLARAGEPNERIRYRDPIVAHGVDAIAALKPWLVDPTLRSFAAVVITEVGRMGGKAAAREALLSAIAKARHHRLHHHRPADPHSADEKSADRVPRQSRAGAPSGPRPK